MLTEEVLSTKTNKELVQIFNEIPGTEPVKRFSSTEVAVRRILAVSQPGCVKEEPEHESVKKRRGRPRTERGVYNREGKTTKRNVRPTSKLGQLVTLLSEGATYEEACASLDFWTPEKIHSKILTTNWWLGYTLTTDADGKITIS